jgi:hypothetical protein
MVIGRIDGLGDLNGLVAKSTPPGIGSSVRFQTKPESVTFGAVQTIVDSFC